MLKLFHAAGFPQYKGSDFMHVNKSQTPSTLANIGLKRGPVT